MIANYKNSMLNAVISFGALCQSYGSVGQLIDNLRAIVFQLLISREFIFECMAICHSCIAIAVIRTPRLLLSLSVLTC